MLRLAFLVRLHVARLLVNVMNIVPLNLPLLHEVFHSVNESPTHARVQPRLLLCVELVEHQPQLWTFERFDQLSCCLLDVFVKASMPFEAELSEAIVVLAYVMGVHLFKLRFEVCLKMGQ